MNDLSYSTEVDYIKVANVIAVPGSEHFTLKEFDDSDLQTNDLNYLAEVDYIDIADITAAAGSGYFILEDIQDKNQLPVSRSTMQEYGLKPKYTLVVPVKGSSMEPTVPDGCLVLVDTTPVENKDIIDGKVYVISLDNLCYIKRFKLVPRSTIVNLESDNQEFNFTSLKIDTEFNSDNLKIIGRLACIIKSNYKL